MSEDNHNTSSLTSKSAGQKKQFSAGLIYGLGFRAGKEAFPCIVEGLRKIFDTLIDNITFA